MNVMYKAKDRFTGEWVKGYAVINKVVMGVEISVLFTKHGEVNCFSDSVEVMK